MIDLELWQKIAGVAGATVLVLAVAVWARRTRQNQGRHRPERVAHEPDVFARVITAALAAATEPPAPEPVDDWTADLPTGEIPAITDADLAEVYDDVSLAAARFVADTRPGEARHTSPSERARERWGIECPIFAQLADQFGYDPARGFDAQLVSA